MTSLKKNPRAMKNKGMDIMGRLNCICISSKRGLPKEEADSANLIEGYGIENDAHAGKWHRQVSILPFEQVEEFKAKGDVEISNGIFGENLIIQGIPELYSGGNIVGSRIEIGGAMLEITQIGKECHDHCEIFKRVGDCIMPRVGLFSKVIKGGTIKKGDKAFFIPPASNAPFTAAVITLSDKGARGERKDESGPYLTKALEKEGYEIIETLMLPDDRQALKRALIRLSDQRQVNLILTTGGTGFSKRDITPEATMEVATKNAPGIAEAIRAGSMQITKRAMLSRGSSVIRNETLIINLPGSRKAVEESLDIILGQLGHGLKIMLGREGDCAR